MWTKRFLPKEVVPAVVFAGVPASPPVNPVVAVLAGVNPFPNPPSPPNPGVVVAVVVGCFAVPNEVVLAERPLVRPVRPPSVVPAVAAGLAGAAPNDVAAGLAGAAPNDVAAGLAGAAPNDVAAGLAAPPSDTPAPTLSRSR